MSLSKEHQDKISSSALSFNDIKDLQLDSWGNQLSTKEADSKKPLYRAWMTWGDGSLRIPYLKPDGQPEECHDGKPFFRYRLSYEQIAERKRKGEKKPPKYLSPKGEGCRLYHSHLALQQGDYKERLNDRFTPLRITEGELKTESASAHDPARLTIGLGGINSWKDRYDGQGKGEESKPLADWDEIPLQGREVRLCFDSDLQKPQVAAALKELSWFLLEKGARVLIEVLPHGLDGERLGLDDLIHRHGPEVFHRIASIARSPFKERKVAAKDGVHVYYDWAFNPEPQTTHHRNVYLSGLLGRHWRRSSDAKDRWQQWNGLHWTEAVGDDLLTESIEAFAELQGWQDRELQTIRSLQAAFRRTISEASDQAKTGIVPFRNGALVLCDMRLVPHCPEHGNTWALSYDYSSEVGCPRIEALLLDRLDDGAAVSMFRAFARSLLTGERTKCFLEITGTGDTGKSVLANLLIALVGKQNTAAMTLQRLEDRSQRFETLKLRQARLAVFSECQDYSGQLQVLKQITGDDPIGGEIKGGRHVDFVFTGGVVLVGNGPVRASDPTGAVINRRRSMHVGKVVRPKDQRALLENDGNGGWRGELVAELPGFINWALAMPASEARKALARDVQSLSRAEAELDALLATDYLADWADQTLVWEDHPGTRLRVGTAEDEPAEYLFASYLRFMRLQGGNVPALSLRTFKPKLVDMMRDTLGLPMPAGRTNTGDYRVRGSGSVIPHIRFRSVTSAGVDAEPDQAGVIRYGFMARIGGTDQQDSGTGAERVGNGKNPVGNGWNGLEAIQSSIGEKTPLEAAPIDPSPYTATELEKPVPSVPSVPHSGTAVPHPFPKHVPSVPQATSAASEAGSNVVQLPAQPAAAGKLVLVDGKPGWRLPGGTMPRGNGPNVNVLLVDPKGKSTLVERRRIHCPKMFV